MSLYKLSLKSSNGFTGSLLSVDATSQPYISRFHEHLTTDVDPTTDPSASYTTSHFHARSRSPTSSARWQFKKSIKKVFHCARYYLLRRDYVKCQLTSDKMDNKAAGFCASPSAIDRLDKHGNLQPVGAQMYAPNDPMSLMFTDTYFNEYPDEHPDEHSDEHHETLEVPAPSTTPGPSSTTTNISRKRRRTKAEVKAFVAQWSPGKAIPQHIPGRVWRCQICGHFRSHKCSMRQHMRDIHSMDVKEIEVELNAALPLRAKPIVQKRKVRGRGNRRTYELLKDDEPSEWEEDDGLNSVQDEDDEHE